MNMFGCGISYLTIDLIRIWKSSDENDFAGKRDRYLAAENPPDASYYRQLDYDRIEKIVRFIDRYIDCVTPENEMKMEIYFNQDQPRLSMMRSTRVCSTSPTLTRSLLLLGKTICASESIQLSGTGLFRGN